MSTLQSIFYTAILLLLIFSAMAYLFQRQMIYYPDTRRPVLGAAAGLGFEAVELKSRDGLQLLAWYKKAREQKATLIYLHGNAGNISYRLPLAKPLIAEGFGMLLVGYRGYGGNPGSPSEKGLYLDGDSAIAFLDQQQVPESHRVLFGESLGTGVAVEMASKHQACALILQSPFSSLPELARWHYPFIFIKPRDRFNSIDKIVHIDTPLLILHGEADHIVPQFQGLALYNAAQSDKHFVSYPGLGHNDLWHEDFYQQISRFISKHCPS